MSARKCVSLPPDGSISSSSSRTETDIKDDGSQPLYGDIKAYQVAILQIKVGFVVESQGILKGFCLSLATATGPDFLALVRAFDPMALLIMVYFGVLFDQLARDDKLGWWVGDTARELVGEVSDLLQGTSVCMVPDGQKALAWARRQVGLPVSPNESFDERDSLTGSDDADLTTSDSVVSEVSAT